jgi:hypothetical protein
MLYGPYPYSMLTVMEAYVENLNDISQLIESENFIAFT